MYEYKCSNEACEHVWSIKEGDINSMYLTCPVCKKGRGQFIRQVKNDEVHEDIQRIAVRKTEDVYIEPLAEVMEFQEKVQKLSKEEVQEKKPKTRGRKKKVPEVEVKTEETAETKLDEKPKKKVSQKDEKQVEIKVSETKAEEEEIEEEDIFTRIIKKREMEAKLRQGCEDEDTDILEVSGNTLEEIESRIKEFEEYYYIKVLDKNIQKQGKRYNCIIKYCRK